MSAGDIPAASEYAAAFPRTTGSTGAAKLPSPATHKSADVPVNVAAASAPRKPAVRKPADLPVSEPEDRPTRRQSDLHGTPQPSALESGRSSSEPEPALEPVWAIPGRARRSVPVGTVHVQNLGDIEGRRPHFVMALHITRVQTQTGDFFGISATKEWGATLNGRWLAIGDVRAAEMTSHAKTWWRLGNPESNQDLLWDIVAHDRYFSIRSVSTSITRGGWLYAALPEVDQGHRRVLTWTQEGHPSDDADMRWSLSPEAEKRKANTTSESRSISIADVNRWKGISDPKVKVTKEDTGGSYSM